jgi:cation diffusion facilitator CzcD-associated flavoprotein CzcO
MVLDVAIIGSGFGGLGAAVRLRKSGIHDIAILERADDVGETWRDNTYRCNRVHFSESTHAALLTELFDPTSVGLPFRVSSPAAE